MSSLSRLLLLFIFFSFCSSARRCLFLPFLWSFVGRPREIADRRYAPVCRMAFVRLLFRRRRHRRRARRFPIFNENENKIETAAVTSCSQTDFKLNTQGHRMMA